MINDLEALNQKWLAYEFNEFALHEMITHPDRFTNSDLKFIGALQPITVATLHQADTFCWHPDPIDAVTDAVRTMPEDVGISDGLFPSPRPDQGCLGGMVVVYQTTANPNHSRSGAGHGASFLTCASTRNMVQRLYLRSKSGLHDAHRFLPLG